MKLLFFLPLIPFIVFSQISDQPNVVLFMADDMGMGDTSAYQFYTKNSDDQQISHTSHGKACQYGHALYRCPHPIIPMHSNAIRITDWEISLESPNEALGAIWCSG